MTDKLKNILIIVGVAVISFLIYSIFLKGDPEPTVLLESEGQVDSADVLGADIIKAINQISSLDLDRSIFSDPVLRSLVDRSQLISPEPKGRENPFAPIGVVDLTDSQAEASGTGDALDQ